MIDVEKNKRATGWQDLVHSGLNLETTGPNPPTLKDFRSGLYQYAFIGTGVTVEQAFASFHIPHDYKSGTKIYPHVHWSHNIAVPSGDVVWQMDYSVSRAFSLGGFPAPTSIELQQTAGAQYIQHVIEVSEGNAIPATNIEPDSMILLRLYRDPAHANDDFGNDAFIVGLDLHYESDGSLTNEKAAPFTKR
ncbi:hypothetical protein KAR91_04365 [Candidatus Pacearchaeota archaeon]|nr:hypothetical protein [Candidatus Pacearchaeota archaeon]